MILKSIEQLNNVGLFQEGIDAPATFTRATLVYGENGRGKSTTAAVLAACAAADASRVMARKTLDGGADPEIILNFDASGAARQVRFNNGNWSGPCPGLVVFDSAFVDTNVYSGQEVRSDQRQALLEFAIGEQAVALKRLIDEITGKIDAATRRRSDAEAAVQNIAQDLTAPQIGGLASVPDAQEQIDALTRRLQGARDVAALTSRRDPVDLASINLDIGKFRQTLSTTLADVEKAAMETVRKHFDQHRTQAGFEDWIAQGQRFGGDSCPFCGQDAGAVPLLAAYRSYFNEQYLALKRAAGELRDSLDRAMADALFDSLKGTIALNTAAIVAWRDRINVTPPELPLEPLRTLLGEAREVAIELAERKSREPLEPTGTAQDFEAIAAKVEQVNRAIQEYNRVLDAIRGQIAAFRAKLSLDDPVVLQRQVRDLERAITRHGPSGTRLVQEFEEAARERKDLDEEKTRAREQLDTLLAETLEKYQERINQLLTKFGAGFSIRQMKATYQGSGEPRTEYGLVLRKRDVRLGRRNEDGPHFGTTLSEGDKRTLAFAFFVARLELDPQALSELSIVLDDPVSSFDRNRRAQTVRLVTWLAAMSEQLVVLSHDAYFIREVRDALERDKKSLGGPPTILGILRAKDDFSKFGECDIDDICASEYYRHHQDVRHYVAGNYQGHIGDVAKALRPLLEGYFHRRYPGLLPKRCMFGAVIGEIEKAAAGSPVSYWQPKLKELRELNDFASRFHHDTDAAMEVAAITDGQLKPYAERVLELVYRA